MSPSTLRRWAAALAFALCASRTSAACAPGLTTEFLPIPIWSTLPNEGDTWGLMPVFLRICPDDRRTESIIAPSVSWNSVIQYTGTFRWFHYPTDETALVLVLSASTNINRNGLLTWQRLPSAVGETTDEATVRVQRDVFFRFFGLGPDTPRSAESSYTRRRALGSFRRGLNVAPHLNLGGTLGVEWNDVEDLGVPGLPLSRQTFPQAPGMAGGSVVLTQAIDLRYDDRSGGDYAEQGTRVEGSAGVIEGLTGSPSYLRGNFQARRVWVERPWASGAARFTWLGVSSGDAPFYHQASLGGSFVLRGYMPDRFIDRQAWELELEQRLRVLETRIFGVVTDWRVDPFVAVGQVYGPLGEAFSHPRAAVGLGFRAFVRPNVLGRVDLAKGIGEDFNVYVELGYPY